MEVYEIAGDRTGISREGVNFLQPRDSFQLMRNGFIYRQELQSRKGFKQFSTGRLGNGATFADGTRVMGIFEHILPDTTKDLLAITKKYLYKYNTTTNTFDQIPNNSAVAFVDFAIPSNDDYVSGTSYPFADGSQRFVFTGKGMSDVYFYDGTQVKRFTNLIDNPNYQAPAAGALTRATYVAWFGERLNFFVPTIAAQLQPQMVLYSGIRNTSGSGDKFNVPGSGAISADTFDYMTGAVIAGDYMVLEFNRSTYTLEKTRDVFNPYFIRKIPGVLGTDAQFSAVSWNNRTESIGKTGILSTDGRESVRCDTKIPYFTADEISQADFNLTYGGFDRINSQYLFSYRDPLSNLSSITQDKVLVNNYEESTWAMNDQRFSVFGQTDKGQDLAWNDIDENEDPSWARMDQTEEIWNKIGIEAAVQKTLAGDDLGFIYEINTDYDDYFVAISAITQASAAVLTITESAFQIGDLVSFANVGGMTQINGLTANVIAATTTSITVNIDSTLFSAYTSGGSVSKVISFYAETIPFNPYRNVGRRCFVSHVEFLLNTNNGNLTIDVFDDENETPFKTGILLVPTETTRAREWITMTVNQEANFLTFAMSQQNPSSQVIITSVRIHCEIGGLTSA